MSDNKPDPDYEDEFMAAIELGFQTLFINFEDYISGNIGDALKKIPRLTKMQPVMYRGWMLTPQQYDSLYELLEKRNFRLINTPEQYRNCHYLPDSLTYIQDHTPHTVYEVYNGEESIEKIIAKVAVFNGAPVIIKDYVKSEKHYWDSACYVSDSSDKTKLMDSIRKFISLRGQYLNEGIVLREFVPLKHLAIHSKSSMPLTEEYRLFFYRNELVGTYDYWEEGEYAAERPDIFLFEQIARNINSNFFTMDIARRADESFIIIELGDGQVSGLPDKLEKKVFYSALTKLIS